MFDVLLPEKIAMFRVAVPAEYELSLIDAISKFGNTALKAGGMELHHVMPKLLSDVLQGWVSPLTLDIDLTLDTIRRVLRSRDEYRIKIENLVREYRWVEKIENLAKRLDSMGISPDQFIRPPLKVKFDYMCVESDKLLQTIHELKSLEVIIRRIRIDEHNYFLVLIYEKDREVQVKKLKESMSSTLFSIPEWFFDKPQSVLMRAEEEKNKIRKELFETLLDVAEMIKDAVEYEKTSRIGTLENAQRLCKEIKASLTSLNSIIKDLMIATLARAIVEENRLDILEKLNIDEEISREILELIKSENKLIVLERIRLIVESSDLDPPIKEKFKEIFVRFVRIYLRARVFEELLAKNKIPLSRRKDFQIGIFFGEYEYIENLSSELDIYGIKTLTLDLSIYDVLVTLVEDKKTLNTVQNIAERYPVLRLFVKMTEDPLKMLANFEKSLEVEEEVVVGGVILVVTKETSLEKLANLCNDKDLIEIAKRLTNLERGLYKKKSIPAKTIIQFVEFLKNLIDKADIALSEIDNLKHRVEAEIELILGGRKDVLEAYKRTILDIISKAEEVLPYEEAIDTMAKLHPALGELKIFRNRRITVAEGYIPLRHAEEFQKTLSENVPKILYLSIKEVLPPGLAPTYIKKSGLWKHLHALVDMLGTPRYREVNPAPFLVPLFVIMYGLMFGDIGQGILIALFGAWLLKTKYPILGISKEGAASLGALALLSGVSGAVFGALYGCVIFLHPFTEPIWIRPLHDVYSIIGIALLFGVIQLILAMSLNVVNYLLYRDYGGAIFSGTGLMGILYYIAGVYMAYNIVVAGYDLHVVTTPEVQIAIYIILFAISCILVYALYESIKTRKTEKLMHAVTEIIEMLIAYPSNTLSYIRLAAFAMAHEAFGELAYILASMIGPVASYVLANILVLAIEGLGVGIQALRLTFYEFSTKFFKGGGIEFKPIIELAMLEELQKALEE